MSTYLEQNGGQKQEDGRFDSYSCFNHKLSCKPIDRFYNICTRRAPRTVTYQKQDLAVTYLKIR